MRVAVEPGSILAVTHDSWFRDGDAGGEPMSDPLVREQSPTEFFKELVESALARQHVHAADLTEYYLVNLLCRYVRLDRASEGGARGGAPGLDDDQPLAVRLAHAFETAGVEQRLRLRSIGDFSLFMSGFFPDSFARRSVDVDYFKSMGEYAYGSLGRADDEAFADVFRELARKFVGFTDVLADISERTAMAPRSTSDVLRLYEKWLRTGSQRDGRRLLERGILPNQSIGRRFMQ
jgi:hypothetical protein